MNLLKPETWQTAKLSELAIYVLGGDWGKDVDFESPDYTTALCIRGAEFRNWNEDKGSTASPRKIKKSSLANRILKDGDILIEISGGGPEQPVGRTILIDKAALSHDPNVPKICTNFVRLLRTADEMDSLFLNLYLTFFYASGEIRNYQAGSNNLRNLKFNDYLELDIPIPPLSEQHRIVAKIEELFSELDKGIENLKTAQSQLKVYRQALLKHAFEGKLTAQWRAENQDKLESADTLLKRIQQERAQRYQQQLAEWEKSPSVPLLQRGKPTSTVPIPLLEKGGRGGISKPKPPKTLPPLTAEELIELPELPEGWGWFLMGDVCLESILGKMLDKEKNKGELKPYLRNINVRWGKFALDNLLEMRFEESEYVRFGLKDGDLVICEGGEPGRCAVWRKELGQDMQIQKALHRVRFTDSINSFFVQMYFELCASNRRLEKMFTGTTIKHLTGERLVRMVVPICSINEQMQILLSLESKFSEADQLDQTITTSLQQAEALRQSILKKAFSGQLVPQDPNDEPASELLARIKAERESSASKCKEP